MAGIENDNQSSSWDFFKEIAELRVGQHRVRWRATLSIKWQEVGPSGVPRANATAVDRKIDKDRLVPVGNTKLVQCMTHCNKRGASVEQELYRRRVISTMLR